MKIKNAFPFVMFIAFLLSGCVLLFTGVVMDISPEYVIKYESWHQNSLYVTLSTLAYLVINSRSSS